MNAGPRRIATLVCSVAGAAIVALDGTVLTVAQPTMQRDLEASFQQVQWTSTGYLIAVASLLVFAGRLGDRYGHRRLFALGTIGFGATSAAICLAPGIRWVIALRVTQGICGALLQPATLGMLRAVYPPDRLASPIALRTSAIAAAAAAGPVIGGALTTHLGWRAVFFLNVVPALLIGGLALGARPTTTRNPVQPERTEGLDLPGAGLLAAALVFLVHTLTDVSRSGWNPATTAAAVMAVLATGALVRREQRAASPLIPAEVIGSTAIASSLAMLLAASAAMFGAVFMGTYLLQDVLGMNPLQCALAGLPGPAAMVLSAPLAAWLQRRWGPRRTAATAMALLALGVLALSRLGAASGSLAVGGAFLVLGAGFGAVMVTATAVIVRRAPARHAGVAGGLQQTVMNVGPALGIATAIALLGRTTLAMPFALAALAVVAAAGALTAIGLPGCSAHTTRAPEPPPVSVETAQRPTPGSSPSS
ncbi:MFS transporter [Streptomyces sp. NPDC127084]|uniref:MFS transporter n=1 Tax=Streptomyces sp. NPDC127084 TaxID=3347133 RepID=UPI00365473E4